MTPEVALDKIGHFAKRTLRKRTCPFMQRLVGVAIDECHLIWDWEKFRRQYAWLGNLRLQLGQKIPWLCLSATLTPNVSGYVHRVCKLRQGTIRFWMSNYRDNINIMVEEISESSGIAHLIALIPKQLETRTDIPKTLIFHDSIDEGIRIAKELERIVIAKELERRVPQTRRRSRLVRSFYGSIDEVAKSRTLEELREGSTRIVVCTDAFGLGVNIPDIDRVIQWKVNEKLTCNALSQRIGRCVRDKTRQGIAVVYADRNIIRDMRKACPWEDAWDDQAVIDALSRQNQHDQYDEDEEEDVRVIPALKGQEIGKFGLPVKESTQGRCETLRRHIYHRVRSLHEAHLEAKRQKTGTRTEPVTGARKLDPSVLWVLCTTGCRHKALGWIFKDPDVFTTQHKHWCCDNCAAQSGDLSAIQTHGISAAHSISNPTPPPRNNDPQNNPNTVTEPAWQIRIDDQRKARVLHRLESFRQYAWVQMDLPDTVPEMILSDDAIKDIVNDVRRIVTEAQLLRRLEKSGIRLQSSFLGHREIVQLLMTIQGSLREKLEPVAILPKIMGGTGARSHARIQPRRDLLMP